MAMPLLVESGEVTRIRPRLVSGKALRLLSGRLFLVEEQIGVTLYGKLLLGPIGIRLAMHRVDLEPVAARVAARAQARLAGRSEDPLLAAIARRIESTLRALEKTGADLVAGEKPIWALADSNPALVRALFLTPEGVRRHGQTLVKLEPLWASLESELLRLDAYEQA